MKFREKLWRCFWQLTKPPGKTHDQRESGDDAFWSFKPVLMFQACCEQLWCRQCGHRNIDMVAQAAHKRHQITHSTRSKKRGEENCSEIMKFLAGWNVSPATGHIWHFTPPRFTLKFMSFVWKLPNSAQIFQGNSSSHLLPSQLVNMFTSLFIKINENELTWHSNTKENHL